MWLTKKKKKKKCKISKQAIEDAYKGLVCKGICSKSEDRFVQLRRLGKSQVAAARQAITEELKFLRDKGLLPDDILLDAVLEDLKRAKHKSKNLNRVLGKMLRAAGEECMRGNNVTFYVNGKNLPLWEKAKIFTGKTNNELVSSIVIGWLNTNKKAIEETCTILEEAINAKKKEIEEKNRRLFG